MMALNSIAAETKTLAIDFLYTLIPNFLPMIPPIAIWVEFQSKKQPEMSVIA